jgi:hypothetical protein
MRPGELQANRTCRVGIVSEVHRLKNCVAEVIAGVKCPQRRFEAFEDVPMPRDLGGLASSKTP